MGLLTGAMAGLGAGLTDTGNFLMRVTADEEKEKRLRKFEMAREQRQNERKDMIRAEDRQWQREDYDMQREHSLEDYEMQRGHAVEDRDFQASFTLSRDAQQYERAAALERYRQDQQTARSKMAIDARKELGTSSVGGLLEDSDDLGLSDSELRQRYTIARELEGELKARVRRAEDDTTKRALQHELNEASSRRSQLEQRLFSGVGGSQPPSANAESGGIMDVNDYLNSLSFLN
jgi:hypothetical protein